MAKAKAKKLNVQYATIGIGKELVRISMAIDRTELTLTEADSLFTGAQLKMQMSCDPNAAKDAEGQQKMKSAEVKVDVIGECKGVGIKKETLRISVSMPKDDVEVALLSKFAALAGTITCQRTGDCDTNEEE